MMNDVYSIFSAIASGGITNIISQPVLDYAHKQWGINDKSKRWLIVVGVNVIVSMAAYGVDIAVSSEPFVTANLSQYILLSFFASQAWWAKEVHGQVSGSQTALTQLITVVDNILAEVARPDTYNNRQYTISAETIDKLDKANVLGQTKIRK